MIPRIHWLIASRRYVDKNTNTHTYITPFKDLRMSRGIAAMRQTLHACHDPVDVLDLHGSVQCLAVSFKEKFSGLPELHLQRPRVGDVIYLRRDNIYVYYLVTKTLANSLPRLQDIHMALFSLRQKMEQHKETRIAIPKIACGLDLQNWETIKNLLSDVFEGSDIEIHVYIP